MKGKAKYFFAGSVIGLVLGVILSESFGKIDLLSETINTSMVLKDDFHLLDETHEKVVLPTGLVANLESKYRDEYHFRIDFISYGIEGFQVVDDRPSYVIFSSHDSQGNTSK